MLCPNGKGKAAEPEPVTSSKVLPLRSPEPFSRYFWSESMTADGQRAHAYRKHIILDPYLLPGQRFPETVLWGAQDFQHLQPCDGRPGYQKLLQVTLKLTTLQQ